MNRGQPTVFSPGRHESAFTVRGVDSAILAWTVKHEGVRTVIVTSEYPIKCAGSPPTTLPLKVFPLCVRRTGSTYMARFGYINPNHGDVVLPIGASNSVAPRPQDRGQPTTLRPGIAWSAFTVRRIPLNGAVTWTVRCAGETVRATATADLKRNCVFTEEGPAAQLEIDKSVEPDAVIVGNRVTFTIVVRNEGTTQAQNATVIDRVLDERIVQLSATASQGRCVVRSSGRVICRLGPLDPGEAATITVLARARAPGESRNRAVVLSLPEDFGPDNIDRVTLVISPFLPNLRNRPSPADRARGALVALPVAAALASLVLAPAAAGPTGDRSSLSHGHLSTWAYVLRPVASREAPRADAPVVTIVRPETPERKPNLVQALTSRTDEVAGGWVRIRLSILPLGSTGWVPRGALGRLMSSARTSSSTASV